jgi:hypothetical protein
MSGFFRLMDHSDCERKDQDAVKPGFAGFYGMFSVDFGSAFLQKAGLG